MSAMKNPRLLAGFIASVIASAAWIPSVSAQLPARNQPPFLGYFAVFTNKRFEFRVTPEGKMVLASLNQKGEPASDRLAQRVDIVVQELMPDGKSVIRQIKPETLESPQPATDKLEKAVIRGKVTGDAAFEVSIEQQRGVITMGGRLVDPGTLKNPLRFSLRVVFPNAYPEKKPNGRKEEEAFEKQLKDDCVEVKWTDGKRKKQSFEKPVDVASKDLNGPGITAMEVVIAPYKDRKFLFTTTGNSTINLSNNGKTAPLYEGFFINWMPDAEKDKDAQARLSLEVK